MSKGRPNTQPRSRGGYVSLQTKLSITLSGLVILTSALLTLASYLTVRSQLREDVRARLRNIASIAALQVDGDTHSTLTDPCQEGGDTYMRIKRVLQRIRDNSPNIRFIYTWRLNDAGQPVFVVDAESDPNEISHLGEIYYSDNDQLFHKQMACLKGPLADDKFASDKWGTWLSGYAPFYRSDGRREGIIGLDIAASDVIAHERQFLWVATEVFVMTIPIALVLGWLLGSKLTAPIVRMTIASERIAEGDLNHRVPIYANNEIGALALAFNKMTQNLRDEIIARGLQIAECSQAEEKLADLNKELETTVEKLSAANHELAEVAYIAAHDLKTPVRGIGSLASMIRLDYKDKLDEQGKKELDLLVGKAERMNELLDGMLQYCHLERVVVKKEQVNLSEIVQEAIAKAAPHENIEITVENEMPVIRCERKHIKLVFEHLIDNAVRFMDKAKGRIKIACVEKNCFWRFSVADNGPGIEERYFGKIFKLFQMLQPRDEAKGVGIGLPIAKKIVELYDGVIWVESTPGEGSTFFFALPKQESTSKNRDLQTYTVV